MVAGRGQEGALNLAACEIGCMDNAAVGVAALTGQVQGAICGRDTTEAGATDGR